MPSRCRTAGARLTWRELQAWVDGVAADLHGRACRRRSCVDLDVEPGRSDRDVSRLCAAGHCLQSVAASHLHRAPRSPSCWTGSGARAGDRARLGRGRAAVPTSIAVLAGVWRRCRRSIRPTIFRQRADALRSRADPDSVVYLAFTSGTTGRRNA